MLKYQNLEILERFSSVYQDIYIYYLKYLSNYIYCAEEGSVLFNDILNSFYLCIHGVEHLVKDY